GVLQQRLGRDAADVEADTSPVLLLDDGHLLAQLARADRRDIPTRTGAQDNNVKVIGHRGQYAVPVPEGARPGALHRRSPRPRTCAPEPDICAGYIPRTSGIEVHRS